MEAFTCGPFISNLLIDSFSRETPIASLIGHELRVARAAFHPSGRFVGTSRYLFSIIHG